MEWALGLVGYDVAPDPRRTPLAAEPRTYSRHLELMQAAGFVIQGAQLATRTDGIDRSRLARRFRSISDTDLSTSGAFIQAEKPA